MNALNTVFSWVALILRLYYKNLRVFLIGGGTDILGVLILAWVLTYYFMSIISCNSYQIQSYYWVYKSQVLQQV